MQFHRYPLSAGLLGPLRPESPEENSSQKFFHNLIRDPEIFEAEIQKRKSQSSRSQSSGKNDLRWIPIAEEVLKWARLPYRRPRFPVYSKISGSASPIAGISSTWSGIWPPSQIFRGDRYGFLPSFCWVRPG